MLIDVQFSSKYNLECHLTTKVHIERTKLNTSNFEIDTKQYECSMLCSMIQYQIS